MSDGGHEWYDGITRRIIYLIDTSLGFREECDFVIVGVTSANKGSQRQKNGGEM